MEGREDLSLIRSVSYDKSWLLGKFDSSPPGSDKEERIQIERILSSFVF
jgi:hypothetical protein